MIRNNDMELEESIGKKSQPLDTPEGEKKRFVNEEARHRIKSNSSSIFFIGRALT